MKQKHTNHTEQLLSKINESLRNLKRSTRLNESSEYGFTDWMYFSLLKSFMNHLESMGKYEKAELLKMLWDDIFYDNTYEELLERLDKDLNLYEYAIQRMSTISEEEFNRKTKEARIGKFGDITFDDAIDYISDGYDKSDIQYLLEQVPFLSMEAYEQSKYNKYDFTEFLFRTVALAIKDNEEIISIFKEFDFYEPNKETVLDR